MITVIVNRHFDPNADSLVGAGSLLLEQAPELDEVLEGTPNDACTLLWESDVGIALPQVEVEAVQLSLEAVVRSVSPTEDVSLELLLNMDSSLASILSTGTYLPAGNPLYYILPISV